MFNLEAILLLFNKKTLKGKLLCCYDHQVSTLITYPISFTIYRMERSNSQAAEEMVVANIRHRRIRIPRGELMVAEFNTAKLMNGCDIDYMQELVHVDFL